MADQQTQLEMRTGALSCKRGVASTCVNYGSAEFYEGLLEGLPTTAMNRRRVEGIIAECRGKWHGEEPLLIQPTEKPIEWERDTPYPFGEPAALPKIVCVARFYCLEPARDSSKERSDLQVIWFQEEFAFPIDADVLDRLRAMDWEQHAVDGCY